ncbi:N-acetylmuramoyl-L-alanine amidase [Sphingobacterium allocomposti]|uniref:N-acetylmuramoyl-L-alanine amidase n=1 Tax=Sphingobacterium allocomposti TaxID=415956 RepID=A0A5S5DNY0_9SPHI|nr:N-acetylmuramoyl-L-alanine amidase [Sphingobacterium composti Yoo et al. 2007 non Ten et al. 2007]TYP97617.1 N-acetylmuramoyl-L-alanine amidase [Sphingobacterium composti Yoo et al. 2007 non Ten et al. 2007]HLS95142.1 N-acetylmuramoyl-L-alanine amidase [Sphingobacterium sp.]
MTKKLNVKNLSIVVTAIFTLTFSSASKPFYPASQEPANVPQKVRTIVLDAGHGGHDYGARGRQSNEKDIALSVALKLGKKIEGELPGVKVVFTRKTDVFIPLYERPAVANKNQADLFISIHCNSANTSKRKNPSVRGTETFVCGFNRLGSQDVAIRENASILLEDNYKENYGGFDPKDPSSMIVFQLMKNQYRRESIKLASYMQDEYAKSARNNRGVQELSLAVLATAGMPSVLTEIGFISSPTEEEYMLSSSGQNEIVTNLFNAIKTYKTAVER